nr:diguanylate cyclase [Vallitaleaceae bacterium]
IIYVTGLSILDLSSISYMIMGIFVLFGLFKFDMLSLVPVSYQKVFESIDEAVFVIDQNLDIINSNEAANRMFNKAGGIKVGEPIATLCEIYGVCYDCTKKEQVITNKLTEQILNLKITRIYNKRKDIVGYICVFMDVTEAHIAKQKLEKLVITDDLTGISNRRHLLEQYASDIKSKSKDLYMAFIDVDFFKKVNDTYGHQIGDEVLVELAELIKGYFELPSYVGRFGGEEFIAAMHSEDEQSAFAYLDYFRIMVSNHKFAYDIPSITISIGFVESTGNIDEDIRLADKALYYAKENGRNKVISYHDQTIISA